MKTIFAKMVGIFMIVSLAIGATWVTSLIFFYQRSDRANTAHSLANEIDIWMLQARRNEKDFQLRDLQGADFYTAGTGANLAKHEQSRDGLLKAIRDLESLHQAGNAKIIGDLKDAVQGHDTAFSRLVSRYRERGFGEWGAEGEWRTAARAIEGSLSRLGNPRLTIEFLGTRSAEQDYIVRPDAASLDRLSASLDTLRAEAGRVPGPVRSSLIADIDAYSQAMQKYVLIQKDIGLTENDGLQAGMRDAIHKVEPLIASVVEETRKVSQSEIAFRQLLISVLAIMMGGLAAGGLAFSLFARSLSSSIRTMVTHLERVADGDLRAEVDSGMLAKRDEIGVLAAALKQTSEKLRGLLATMQEGALQVAASSEQISRSAQSLAEGAQSQASTLEETAASMEELASSVDQVSGSARSQAVAAEQGAVAMSRVQESIDDISRSLEEISTLATRSVAQSGEGSRAVDEVVDGINRIALSSEKIAGILTVISEIADQTNLLALNASIEAARAGEHGRGFAVVADEVGKLAEKSSTSTKEIAVLIGESVKSVTDGVRTAKGSQIAMEQIRAASLQVNQTISGLSESMRHQGAAVKEMTVALDQVNELSRSVSAATEEQSQGAKQVSRAVESVNEVTQGAAAAAEEMSTSTEQLSTMAQQLQRLVAQFKVDSAIENHTAPALNA